MSPRVPSVTVLLAVLAAACGGAPAPPVPQDGGPAALDSAVSVERTIEEYTDLTVRRARLRANEPRPVPNSALPPRHLDADRFPDALVDRDLIVNGGPPPDGIAPIDAPVFVAVETVDWLGPDESVLVVASGTDVQIHPVQILMWHEIVNTEIDGIPISVTYCPLCGSGLVHDRRAGGRVLDFGTSGSLYQANLVMYDRQTESLWTQFDGRSVVGDLVGAQLATLPSAMVAWSDAVAAHPDARVLSRDTGFDREYGRNLYAAYEDRDEPVPGYFTGVTDPSMPAYERVVGIESGREAVSVRRRDLSSAGVVETEVGGTGVSIWFVDGMRSPLSGTDVAGGRRIGATAAHVAVVDGRPASFEAAGDGTFVDDATGSVWNLLGEAVGGPMTGRQLDPVAHVDTFWFAWATFRPDAAVLAP